MDRRQKVTLGIISTFLFQVAFSCMAIADEEEKTVKKLLTEQTAKQPVQQIRGTEEALRRQEIASKSYLLFTCGVTRNIVSTSQSTSSAQ